MPHSDNRRILVVDDQESIHDDFQKILGGTSGRADVLNSATAALFDEPSASLPTPQGFDLDSAWQGQEAVERVEQSVKLGRPYAVAFVDMRMPPGWDGVETVRRMWSIDPNLQVVICTAYSDYSWSDIVSSLGETDRLLIVKKPFDNIEVRQLATALVAKWNLAREANRTLAQLQGMVREQTRAINSAHEETIHRLVKASLYRDQDTGAHIERTGLYSELLAAAAGWPADQIDQLRLAAPMHDVGKIGIPDAVLCKTGQLTPEEIEVIQTHPVLGANMLAGSTSPVLRMAQVIALNHHERWDGKGYPAGLAGCQIPEEARIVSIVDVYDALTHDRVYRKELSEERALKIMMEGRGTRFDPRLLDIFMSLLPEMRAIAQAVPDAADEAVKSPRSIASPGLAEVRSNGEAH